MPQMWFGLWNNKWGWRVEYLENGVLQTNLTGPVLEPLLQHVYSQIEAAAKKGLSSVQDPHAGFPSWPSSDLQDALWNRLRNDGYKVVHHPDPDPGHPGSSDFYLVSW